MQSSDKDFFVSGNLADRDREAIIQEIKEIYQNQLKVLKDAISEERKEAALSQQTFEQALRTKYDNLVSALQDKMKAEQEARLQRAMDDLERTTRLENQRMKEALEIQQAAEVAMTGKLKNIVNEFQESWKTEEQGRARALEDRLRSHYSALLEHTEKQLQLSLTLKDEVDKRWMNDLQEKNVKQLETMKAFEEKCRRLYDGRFQDYLTQTNLLIADYEQQLLETASEIAFEKAQFESRLNRLKFSCFRWKTEYQRTLHQKYASLIQDIEAKYIKELQRYASLPLIRMRQNNGSSTDNNQENNHHELPESIENTIQQQHLQSLQQWKSQCDRFQVSSDMQSHFLFQLLSQSISYEDQKIRLDEEIAKFDHLSLIKENCEKLTRYQEGSPEFKDGLQDLKELQAFYEELFHESLPTFFMSHVPVSLQSFLFSMPVSTLSSRSSTPSNVSNGHLGHFFPLASPSALLNNQDNSGNNNKKDANKFFPSSTSSFSVLSSPNGVKGASAAGFSSSNSTGVPSSGKAVFTPLIHKKFANSLATKKPTKL